MASSMKRIAFVVALAIAALGAGLIAWSMTAPAHTILLSNVHAKRVDGEPGTVRVFLTIENSGRFDTLISARSRDARTTTLYSPEAEEGLPIPVGGTPSLALDGAHIVLEGVAGAMTDGRLIPITLEFREAGEVTARARLVEAEASGSLAHVGLFGFGDICTVGEGEPAPAVALEVLPAGDDGGWRVEVVSSEFEFRKDLVDYQHVPGTGHGHLYLAGLKLQRLYEPSAVIGDLPPGQHTVRVTLNTNDHRAYVVDDEPVTAMAVITVD